MWWIIKWRRRDRPWPSAAYCQHFVGRGWRLESLWKHRVLSLATLPKRSTSLPVWTDGYRSCAAILWENFAGFHSLWLTGVVVIAMSDVEEPPDSPSAVTSASTERTPSQTGASPADDTTNASAHGTSLLGTYSAFAPLRASVLTTTYELFSSSHFMQHICRRHSILARSLAVALSSLHIFFQCILRLARSSLVALVYPPSSGVHTNSTVLSNTQFTIDNPYRYFVFHDFHSIW